MLISPPIDCTGANSFADGDPIVYSTGGGNVLEFLINGNTYYVKRVGISSIELYTTYALSSKVDFLSNGTGTHSLRRSTVNATTDQITLLNHGFSTVMQSEFLEVLLQVLPQDLSILLDQ